MNPTSNFQFTILVPVYNESECLPKLIGALSAYLTMSSVSTCVLFVDDGSTDGGLALIKDACAKNKCFYYISFDKNRGKSAALRAGFRTCESPLVGHMDADLQTVPEDFELLLPRANVHALVSGIRVKRKDTWLYRIQSRIGNSFRRWMTGDPATDTGCPLKIFQTPYAKQIPMFTGMHRFLCALVLLQDGATYWETPVRHFDRVAGTSKYNLWNRLGASLTDCFGFRWMSKRYINYKVKSGNL